MMKKLLLIFLLLPFLVKGQSYQQMPQSGYGPVKRMMYDSVLTLPMGIASLRNIAGGRDTGQIRYLKSDSSVYVYTGFKWLKLAKGNGVISVGVDSITLSSNLFCQWVGGSSTCYRIVKFFDSSSINYNSTKIIYWNAGISVDSITSSVSNVTKVGTHLQAIPKSTSGAATDSLKIQSLVDSVYKPPGSTKLYVRYYNPNVIDSSIVMGSGGGGGTITISVSADSTWYIACNSVTGRCDSTKFQTSGSGGTVTNLSALTLGTTGTDLSSSVANPTTTPVITLNVPTASAANRGALSAADWSTFSSKQAALSGTGYAKFSGITPSYIPLIPITDGGTGVSSVTVAPVPSAFAGWDPNKNLFANNHVNAYTTTVTAAGTTALTASSTYLQFFTGTANQTVTLPANSVQGMQFYIRNNSTGLITINSSAGGLVRIIGASTRAMVTSLTTSGTTTADWSANYLGGIYADGKTLTINNSISLSGTDGAVVNVGAGGTMLTNITGLVTQGTNVTVTGSGTTGSPYVVNSISSGGITGIGVATRIPFWNGASSLTSDTSFRYSPTGSLYSTKMYAGMVLNPVVASAANLDTLVALQIDPIYNVGANTGVIKQTLKIEKTYFNVDSLYNFSWGNGNAAANQVYGNTLFLGKNAGAGATGAYQAIMLGIDVGVNATNATNSVFLGNGAGNGATNANTSFFVGANAGYGATGANNSNFLGNGAGNGATTASYANYLGVNAGYQAVGSGSSNFFGAQAGYNATGASSSNFLGSNAGQNATNSSTSNFFGLSAGQDAVSSLASNFMGYDAGHYSTNSDNSNFYGRGAGFRALSAPFSNFFGTFSGQGSSGASYSNFFGFNTGDSTNFKITGTNNILLGTNITTPAAASTNTLNIGNVLYGTNLYSNTTGNPASAAQTTGQIGINVTTPATSAVLDVTSTTKGFLKPRMTTTQKNAIATPAEGLTVYDLTLHQMSYYNGTAWINY